MGRVILPKFSFKPIEKKRTTPVNNGLHRISKRLYCICVEETPNNFVAHINMKNDKVVPDIQVLPFTERSYDLKGKTKVFSVFSDINNRGICIIREKTHATNFPGLTSQYTPFRNNYVYSGYIVSINGKHYFDVDDVYENVNYCRYLIYDDELKTDSETK